MPCRQPGMQQQGHHATNRGEGEGGVGGAANNVVGHLPMPILAAMTQQP
jgi:hypothetical protein